MNFISNKYRCYAFGQVCIILLFIGSLLYVFNKQLSKSVDDPLKFIQHCQINKRCDQKKIQKNFANLNIFLFDKTSYLKPDLESEKKKLLRQGKLVEWWALISQLHTDFDKSFQEMINLDRNLWKYMLLQCIDRGLVGYADEILKRIKNNEEESASSLALEALLQTYKAGSSKLMISKVNFLNKGLHLIDAATDFNEDNYFVRLCRLVIHLQIPQAFSKKELINSDLDFFFNKFESKQPVVRGMNNSQVLSINEFRSVLVLSKDFIESQRKDLQSKIQKWKLN